jgi:hypothetical protein
MGTTFFVFTMAAIFCGIIRLPPLHQPTGCSMMMVIVVSVVMVGIVVNVVDAIEMMVPGKLFYF